MKAFFYISIFLLLSPSFAWGRMQAIMIVQNKKFSCQSFKTDNVFQFYSPDVILLKTGISYNAALEFEIIHQNQMITHLNYHDYRLNLELDYENRMLSIPAIALEDDQIQLSLRINDIEAKEDLFIHISNDLGEILATFHFPIELSKDDYIASTDYNQVSTYDSRDQKKAFAEAPLYIHAYNLQTKAQENYLTNSSQRIPLKKGYDYLITISIDLADIELGNSINQLQVVTEWIGKGLINKASQEPGYRFYVRTEENDQFNDRITKTIPRTSSVFWSPYSFWNPNNQPNYNLDQSSSIEDIYSMQIFITNERMNKINTKTIDFYILK